MTLNYVNGTRINIPQDIHSLICTNYKLPSKETTQEWRTLTRKVLATLWLQTSSS